MQGGGAIGERDRVAGADIVGKRGLESLDPWPGGQEIVAQRRRHRRDVIVLDGLAAVGQERRRLWAHAAAFSSTIAIRAAAESQSVLVSLA